VSVLNLLILSHLTNDEMFEQSIHRTLGMFAPRITQSGRTVPMMMAALSMYYAGIAQIVIAGDRAAGETRALMDVVRRRYMPFAVIVPLGIRDPGSGIQDSLTLLLPWTEAMARHVDQSTAYVCRDFACLTPATSADELSGQLERSPR
jgi:uncharacterized protein YyaL (SSP411 family)